MIIVKTKNDLLPGGDLSSPTIRDFTFTNKELEALNADTAVIKYECEIFGPMSGKYIHGKIRWEPDWEKISAQN
jgi:hypothetical protein